MIETTTTAEVEGRGFCEVHGHFDGERCPDCVTDAQIEASPQGDMPRPRGFARMDRARVSEIARLGGKAAHSAGTAHAFTSDEAREAGRKGGRVTHERRKKAREASK